MLVEKPKDSDSEAYKALYQQWKADTREQREKNRKECEKYGRT